MISIDLVQKKIHEGVSFVANFSKTALANNATTNLRIKTNTKAVHLSISADVTANFKMETYEGTTYTANGTAPNGTTLTLFNRIVGHDSVDANVYFDATVNALGTKRGSRIFPGGTGIRATGGSGSDRLETIIPPNKDLLIVFTSQSGGQTGDITAVLDWYEVNVTPRPELSDFAVTDLDVLAGETPVVYTPTFAATTKAYTSTVEWQVDGITTELTTTPEATFQRPKGEVDLEVGANILYAEAYKDGYNPESYKLTVTRKALAIAKTLTAAYTVGAGEDAVTTQLITFDPYTFTYAATVPNDITSVDVAFTTDYTGVWSAEVVANAVALDEGENEFTLTVTNATRSTAVYTITITREEE